MVRPAAGIQPQRHHADRLAFKDRERHTAEIKHKVVCVVIAISFAAYFSHPKIASDGGGNELGGNLGTAEIGIAMRRRPGWQHGTELDAVKDRFS